MGARAAFRYPGTRPFEDTALDREVFAGRKEAVERLLHHLLAERLVVLYGRSGVGKSSLVGAGLLDSLRRRGFAPCRVRLNDRRADFVALVDQAFAHACDEHGWECYRPTAGSLRAYFKTLEIWQGDLLLHPVLVVDQFEELFTLHDEHGRTQFFQQFAALVRGLDVPANDRFRDNAAPDTRVLLSVREDFLAELERMAPLVPHILHNRFRLEGLTPAEAAEAIRIPATHPSGDFITAPFTFTDDAVTRIILFLAGSGGDSHVRLSTPDIEPFQLQILCSRAEDIARLRQASADGPVCIAYPDLGGDEGVSRALREFYTSAISASRSLRDIRKLQRLCETGLINIEGRRLALEASDIARRYGVTVSVLAELEHRRILRSETRGGLAYYELSHDSLVAPVRDAAVARRRNATRRVSIAAMVTVLIIVSVVLSQLARSQRLRQLVEEAAGLPSLADHDPTWGNAVAIDLLARNLALTGDVAAPIAEAVNAAARSADLMEIGSLPESTRVAALTARGDHVIAAAENGRVAAYDFRGNLVASLEEQDALPVTLLALGQSTSRVAALRENGTHSRVQFWKSTLESLGTVEAPFPVVAMAYSPDERFLALLGSEGELATVDGATMQVRLGLAPGAPTVAARPGARPILAFRSDGGAIAASTGGPRIRLWHIAEDGTPALSRQFVDAGRLIDPRWSISGDGRVVVYSSGLLTFVAEGPSQPAKVIQPLPSREMATGGPPQDDPRVVSSLAVSARGAIVVVGHRDGSVRTFDLTSVHGADRPRATFRAHDGEVQHVAASADGTLIVTVSAGGGTSASPVRLWDADGTAVGELPRSTARAPLTTNDYPSAITSVVFHSHCNLLLTGAADGAISAWSTDSLDNSAAPGTTPLLVKRGVRFANRKARPVLALAVTADEELLAIGDDSGRIELWSPAGPRCPGDAQTSWTLAASRAMPRRDSVQQLAIQSTSRRLLAQLRSSERPALINELTLPRLEGASAVALEESLRPWSVRRANKHLALGGSNPTVAAFLPTGDALLVGDTTGTWRAYPLQAMDARRSAARARPDIESVAHTPSMGEVWVLGDGAPARQVFFTQNSGRALAVQGDGTTWLLDGTSRRKAPSMYTLDLTEASLLVAGGSAELRMVASPGWRLFSRRTNVLADQLQVAEPERLLRSKTLSPHAPARRIAMQGAGHFLAFARGTLVAYDVATGHLLDWRRGVSGRVSCKNITAATYGSHGQLITGCDNGSILLFGGLSEFVTEMRPRRDGDEQAVRALASSGSGKSIGFGTDAGSLTVMGTRDHTIAKAHSGPVGAIAFSPDERTLVSADGGRSAPMIKVWDLSAPQPTLAYTLRGHVAGGVHYIDYKDDGTLFLTAGADGTVHVWSASTRTVVRLLRHAAPVQTAVFAGDSILTQTSGDSGQPSFHLWTAEGARIIGDSPTVPDALNPWHSWLVRSCERLGAGVRRTAPERHKVLDAAIRHCRGVLSIGEPSGLLAASRLGDVAFMAETIRGSSDRWSTTDRLRTVLHDAARRNDAASISVLAGEGANLDARDAQGSTPLLAAIATGGTLAATRLIKAGADVRVSDAAGATALHLAALRSDDGLVGLLLERGANVSARNHLGVTPLMYAAHAGRLSMVRDFIRRGAAVDAKDEFGSSALMDAARAAPASVVRALLEAGANVNAQTTSADPRLRMTPLLWAMRNDRAEVITLLRELSPHVTRPFPSAVFHITLDHYLPQRYAPLRERLRPWSGSGRARPVDAEVLDELRHLARDDAFAQFLLGRAYEVGIGLPVDHLAARRWYQQSAAAGEPIAQVALAVLIWNGWPGVSQDMSLVRELLEQAALRPQPTALARVWYSRFLQQVRGERELARTLLEHAAAEPNPDPTALTEFARRLQNEGRVGPAFESYLRAARAGDETAMFHAGDLARQQRVKGTSLTQALTWFHRAAAGASQGTVSPAAAAAAFHLGIAHQYGLSVPASATEARRWYDVAERGGDLEGPYHHGMLLEQEQSAQSKRLAVRKFYRASLNGFSPGTNKLRALDVKP